MEPNQNNLTIPESSTAPNTGTPTPPSVEPWQPPPNAPAWARGKTPEEILGIASQLYAHIESQAPKNQNPPVQTEQTQFPGSADDYVTIGGLNAQLQQAQQAIINPMMEANSQLAWQMAKAESPDLFNKFGPEMIQYWQRLPPNQRTLDGARMLVKLVQGNHFEELKQEAVRHATQQSELGFRSGGAGTGPATSNLPPLQNEEYPEEWREKAKSLNLSMDDLKDFAKANGMTVKDYMDKYVKVSVGGAR